MVEQINPRWDISLPARRWRARDGVTFLARGPHGLALARDVYRRTARPVVHPRREGLTVRLEAPNKDAPPSPRYGPEAAVRRGRSRRPRSCARVSDSMAPQMPAATAPLIQEFAAIAVELQGDL
ncbi:hypothetical protein ABZ297_19380 [Nonomuraea sp. NPDC005983]|uniref:hypothetical protein n=1 Tax=Nonomuraea sp. NPDC005983 TaxID=3155595 RepID=UPI0033AF63E1